MLKTSNAIRAKRDPANCFKIEIYKYGTGLSLFVKWLMENDLMTLAIMRAEENKEDNYYLFWLNLSENKMNELINFINND